MITGSCCCGEVRFSISRPPKMLAECHCSRCRKIGATPFAMVYRDSLSLEAGTEEIVTYRPDPPYKYERSFCGRCGTSLGEILSSDELFPISANCFDEELGIPVLFHEHVASKPPWRGEIPDGVKQFDGDPSAS